MNGMLDREKWITLEEIKQRTGLSKQEIYDKLVWKGMLENRRRENWVKAKQRDLFYAPQAKFGIPNL